MSRISRQAIGKWYGILTAFGIDPSYLKNKHGPCPMCQEGEDRFRWDNRDGKGTYYCSVCGSGDGFDLLMKIKKWPFKQVANEIEKIIGIVSVDKTKKKNNNNAARRLKEISRALMPVTDHCVVSQYLVSRGLKIKPEMLRYHPNLEYYDDGKMIGKFPAMLALITDKKNESVTYHVTYLNSDGKKADVPSVKKALTPVANKTLNGSLIRLTGVYERIGLAEGIETAIAIQQATAIPCWSTINANGMEKAEIPDGVKEVCIFADNDESYTGQKAAYTLANKLVVTKKLKVSVRIPENTGMDFLDMYNQGRI